MSGSLPFNARTFCKTSWRKNFGNGRTQQGNSQMPDQYIFPAIKTAIAAKHPPAAANSTDPTFVRRIIKNVDTRSSARWDRQTSSAMTDLT
ncbi:MAG TPA: hypothetical protein VI636_04945 [Candidatus Angelobacter sp.]